MADSPIAPSPDPNSPSDYSFTGVAGTDLSNFTISEIYRDLITVNRTGYNSEGLTGELKFLRDGEGIPLPIQVSETKVSIDGDLSVNDLYIGNTINLDSINQYLFNVTEGTTGTVFKLRVGTSDIFSVDSKGKIGVKEIDFEETNRATTSPTVGSVVFDSNELYLYRDDS
jgi:hypothetical protein